jgi:hypothetical protein
MECGLQLPWRKHYSVLDFLTSSAFLGTNPGGITSGLPVIRPQSAANSKWSFQLSPSGCQGNALPSVVKPVVNLDKDFARIQMVCSAKGEAGIQQNAPVCDVYALNVHGKAFAEVLAKREVERGVRLKVIAGNGRIPSCITGQRGGHFPGALDCAPQSEARGAITIIERE